MDAHMRRFGFLWVALVTCAALVAQTSDADARRRGKSYYVVKLHDDQSYLVRRGRRGRHVVIRALPLSDQPADRDASFPSAPSDPFWAYVYANLFSDMFDSRKIHSSRHRRSAHRVTEPDAFARICGRQADELARWPLDGIEQMVKPTSGQRDALANLKNAADQAANDLQAACPREAPRSPVERLDQAQHAIEAMLKATHRVRPPLETFFAALDDEQKARLTATSAPELRAQSRRGQISRAGEFCRPMTGDLLARRFDRLARAARPTEDQLVRLEKLWAASSDGATMLQDFCKGEIALTPPGRLSGMQQRLEALDKAIGAIRPALADFYESLSDAQKARLARSG
jgi:hypothetical protein